jgi:uncharacterized protein YegP (UPF0339 family)
MAIPRAVLRIYKEAPGKKKRREWRWSFIVNGRVMADSAEGYAQKQTARRAWRKLYTRIVGKVFSVREEGTTDAVNPRLVTPVARKRTARKGTKKK